MDAPRRVAVGQVLSVHGVRGALRIRSDCDPPEGIGRYRRWWIGRDAEWRLVVPGILRWHGKALTVQLSGIDEREQAAQMVGCDIAVAREDLPALPEGRYYWHDLIGLAVTNREGQDFGRVVRVVATGADHEVLVVRGDRERWIPFLIGRHVDAVDLAGGRILVDWDGDF